MQASRAARSSSTRKAALRRTAAAPFRAGTRRRRLASSPALRRLLDEKPGSGLLGDRALAVVERHRELIGRGLGRADDDARPRDETLVVEPVQEVAVVLGEPDDRRVRARLERRE